MIELRGFQKRSTAIRAITNTPKRQAITIPAIVPTDISDALPVAEVFCREVLWELLLVGLGGGGVNGGGGGAGDVLNEFPSYLCLRKT